MHVYYLGFLNLIYSLPHLGFNFWSPKPCSKIYTLQYFCTEPNQMLARTTHATEKCELGYTMYI